MKTNTNKYLSLFITLVLVFGMSITACEGPAGADGSQGPEGPTGPVGPAGENGSVMHAGTGAPDTGTGEAGDYYLDTDNTLLYGPKTEGGSWGTPIDLKGSDGQNGADGNQIFSGTTPPDISLGVEGDYYLNTANFDLYGPKTESGWGTPINLKGTANVMYSPWITIPGNAGEWTGQEFFGDSLRYHDIVANALNEEIVNQGVVNVYVDFRDLSPDLNHISPLPISNLPGFGFDIYFQYNTQNIRIAYFDNFDKEVDPGDLNADSKFRFVLIPGGVAAETSLSQEQIKRLSYGEIKQRFGIQN